MTHEKLTRRAFAGAVASVALLPAVSGPSDAQTPTSDPVLPLYADWLKTLAEWKALADINDDWDGPEMVALIVRHCDLGRELSQIIPTTGAGIAVLAHVLWENHIGPSQRKDSPEYAAQFWHPQNRLIYHIWQAASGLPLSAGPFHIPPSTADLES